jgi:hypothetical protein
MNNKGKTILWEERATATVELAIMMPLFVTLLIYCLYSGSAHLIPPRLLANVHWAATQVDPQQLEDLPFDLSQGATANWVSLTEVVELSDQEHQEIFIEADLLEMSNEAAYNIRGHYSWQGGELVYSTSISTTSEGWKTEKYQLNQLNEDVVDEMGLWMLRSRSALTCKTGLPIFTREESQSLSDIDTDQPLEITFEQDHSSLIRRKEGGVYGVPYRRLNRGMDGADGDLEQAHERIEPESHAWQTDFSVPRFKDFWNSDD